MTVTVRADAGSGLTWLVGEMAFAPLAAGDYVIRLTVEGTDPVREILQPVRVVP